MRKAWHSIQFLQARPPYRLDGPKRLEKRFPTRRPYPGDALELRGQTGFAAPHAVMPYREAVRFIPYPLH
jgi:hypothetical protein